MKLRSIKFENLFLVWYEWKEGEHEFHGLFNGKHFKTTTWDYELYDKFESEEIDFYSQERNDLHEQINEAFDYYFSNVEK